eukprot:4571603-Prymnesium_polylepis.2
MARGQTAMARRCVWTAEAVPTRVPCPWLACCGSCRVGGQRVLAVRRSVRRALSAHTPCLALGARSGSYWSRLRRLASTPGVSVLQVASAPPISRRPRHTPRGRWARSVARRPVHGETVAVVPLNAERRSNEGVNASGASATRETRARLAFCFSPEPQSMAIQYGS